MSNCLRLDMTRYRSSGSLGGGEHGIRGGTFIESNRLLSDSQARLGVDVGATFADIVYHDAEVERTLIHKVLTTPDDLSIGVVSGLVPSCWWSPL